MKKRVSISSLLIVCCFGVPGLIQPRLVGCIVGGENATIEEYPFQLSLEHEGRAICGASVIGETWVLTAAHCVIGLNASNLLFRAGSSIVLTDGIIYQTKQFIIHPDYSPYPMDFDIAVVEISTPFAYGPGVQPISLATKEPAAEEVATVTGWGSLNDAGNLFPTQLQVVSVNIIDRTRCQSSYLREYNVPNDMICAGVVGGGKDACHYDSGGPLVVGDKQAGIVSWGLGCGRSRYPGIYSNVAVLRNFVFNVTGIQ